MPLTNWEKLANEKHFDQMKNVIEEGGFYCWINEQECLHIKDGKFNLTPIQLEKLSRITTHEWIKQNTTIKD